MPTLSITETTCPVDGNPGVVTSHISYPVDDFKDATFEVIADLYNTSSPDFAYRVISQWLHFPGGNFHPVVVIDNDMEYVYNYVD